MAAVRLRLAPLLGASALLLVVAVAAACENEDYESQPTSAAPAITASSGETVAVSGDAGDRYLVGPNGHTLYVFANDATGVSNCSGGCADNWPPLVVGGDVEPSAGDGVTGSLDVIERPGGGRQVTLDGAPLYYYAGDSTPGELKGDGIGGVRSVARPSS